MNEPWLSEPIPVEPQWIDYNGHLNMAFYNVLFDRGVDGVFEGFGLGPDYKNATGCSFFTAEAHVRYERELHEGDRVRSTFRILDHDDKRLRAWQELIHEDGWVGGDLGDHVAARRSVGPEGRALSRCGPRAHRGDGEGPRRPARAGARGDAGGTAQVVRRK